MRPRIVAVVFAVALAGVAAGGVAAAGSIASSGGEKPPECVKVTIVENSGNGPRLYAVFCGTGSGGESPLMPGVRRLVVDGAALTAGDCRAAARCVVLWPASPPS
jgi:hypothetical protein